MTQSPVTVEISPADQEVLNSWTRSPTVRAGLAQRARIVLLAAQGHGTNEIARLAGVSRPTVSEWRRRYLEQGLPGLEDRPKPGRPRGSDDIAIVLATLEPLPARLGVTHWSSRLLGKELGLSNAKIADVWREYGLAPRRTQHLTFATEPELDTRVCDVVGVYLNLPTKVIVLRVDRRSRLRSDSTGPIDAELPERPPGDDAGDAIAPLITALREAIGESDAASPPRPRDTGFLAFLEQTAKTRPGTELHVVTDSRAAVAHKAVVAWLAANPAVTVHLTPTAKSWLNLVEIFLAIVNRKASDGEAVGCVGDLSEALAAFLDTCAEDPRPFAWTREPDLTTLETPALQSTTDVVGAGRTTDDLTAAIEAMHARFDALESAMREIKASRASTTELAAAVETLRTRLDTLTFAGSGTPSPPDVSAPQDGPTQQAVQGTDSRELWPTNWWLVRRLCRNTAPEYTRGNIRGSLAWGGVVQAPGCGLVKWQSEFTLPDVLAADLPTAALTIGALGHLVRLEMMRRMLLGASTVADLQEIAGIGTTGQVHHHLRELRGAGFVVSGKRNHYAIPADRVVPFLVIVAAALGRRVHGRAGLVQTEADDCTQDPMPDSKYWMLDHLVGNTGPYFTQGAVSGSIAFGIAASTPPHPVEYGTQGEYSVPDVLAADFPVVAGILAALGHPLRLAILHRMRLGASAVGELMEIAGMETTGRLQHHLRELRGAGLVRSQKRNHYQFAESQGRVFQVCVAAAVGRRIPGRSG